MRIQEWETITPGFIGWDPKGQDKAIHLGFKAGSCQWVSASPLILLFFFLL